ncbi:uncharacterized protein BDR25DRAFT_225863, partial [Lindgomyces ingoldianus]
YMANQMVAWLIKNRLVPGQLEGETARVWNTILQIEFPATAGYATGPETQIAGHRADLFTTHIVFGNQAPEFKFLIVECPRPAVEGQNQVWQDAGAQLKTYLSGIASSRSGGRKFGAVAVGKVVRFYEWDNDSSSLNLLANGDHFYLDRQCASVTRWLRFFRDNHQ